MGSNKQAVWDTMKYLLAVLTISSMALTRDQRAIQSNTGKVSHPLHKLGSLTPNKPEKHPLAGDVFYRVDDDTVLTVVNFKYPSPGPDAFFWVGESGSCDVDSIGKKSYPLAPGKVGTRNYGSPDQPILPSYDGTEKDVVLRLPEGVRAKDLKWLCVWCRKFQVNFRSIEIKN